MFDWLYYLISLLLLLFIYLFIDIPLLYYHINLRSLIICCLSSGDVYHSLSISLLTSIFSSSFVTISELFYGEVFVTFVIQSAILLPIKSPVAFAVFWIDFFEAVLDASEADCLAWSITFWLY